MKIRSRIKELAKRSQEWFLYDVRKDINEQSVYLRSKIDELLSDKEYQKEMLDSIKKDAAADKMLYISPNEILVNTFNGLKIYIDPRDISVAPHLALDGIYEGKITKAWMKLIEKDALTVLDIGANLGYYGALAAQQLYDTKSQIIFFEANTNLIPYIRKTLSVNWLNHISKVENLAISNKSGTAELSVLKDYIGSSSLKDIDDQKQYLEYKMPIEVNEKIAVNTTTVDEYCLKNEIEQVNLIKIDIEGFEEKAYLGMKNIVKNSKDLTLFLEFTKDAYEDPRAFYNQMVDDFGQIYEISEEGKFLKPNNQNYSSVIENGNDWTMIVLSKRTGLDKL